MSEDNTKSNLKFWIGALAFSMLLLAVTFALLAAFLSEIKRDIETSISRSDIIAQRLNTMDMEILLVQHHVLTEKTPAGIMLPVGAMPPADADKAPTQVTVPVIQAPSLQAPAMTPPVPEQVAPATTPPAKP